jgi:hypothetical protein
MAPAAVDVAIRRLDQRAGYTSEIAAMKRNLLESIDAAVMYVEPGPPPREAFQLGLSYPAHRRRIPPIRKTLAEASAKNRCGHVMVQHAEAGIEGCHFGLMPPR